VLGFPKQSRIVVGVLAAALSVAAVPGFAEDRPLPQDQPPTKDTIFARKTVMGEIDMNMDEIETMLAPEGKLVLSDAQEHAEVISTLLMAFPHLFPPSTNQWKQGPARDPATDTFANPNLWSNFSDFYRRASEASKIAWNAAAAKRPEEFRPLIRQLRERCNACHALNLNDWPAKCRLAGAWECR
jgi:cytochrome c556